ncbi:MAG: hypothetical protein M1823_003280 [Watsoniomyces obsoletus]|nr:MAG: hypothetical protein M1823_003280 [Watsoniomyces obsoletus]
MLLTPPTSRNLKLLSHRRSESTPTLASVAPLSPKDVNSSLYMSHEAGLEGSHHHQQEKDDGGSTSAASVKKISKIACIGAGYVGGPTSALIALRNHDVDVTVVDIDAQRISAWNSAILPVYERGLLDVVTLCRDGKLASDGAILMDHRARPSPNRIGLKSPSEEYGRSLFAIGGPRRPNLFFTTKLEEAIREADMIFISVNTPTKMHGVGKGCASDMGSFEAAARSIAQYARSDKIVVEKSTVPCKTADALRKLLEANSRPGVSFEILSNPEFLAEGTAVADLLDPDRVLIGHSPTDSGVQAAAALATIYLSWVKPDRIITMNLWSSELAKLAANALLAQRISSINSLSAICEKTGADIDEVAFACGLDSRLGPGMLKAGPGFGGSCFKKDILSLVYMAESLHLYEVASYWKSVVEMNEYQKDRFAKRIVSCLFDTLTEKKIAVLGFAYKKGTSDTRESPAIDVVCHLVAERARVAIYDPAVQEGRIWNELESHHRDMQSLKNYVSVCRSAYDACHGAHAVVILTEWEEFSNKNHPSLSGTKPQTSIAPGCRNGNVSGTTAAGGLGANGNHAHIGNPSREAHGSTLLRPSVLPAEHSLLDSHGDHANPRLDWRRVGMNMEKPRFVFDGRGIMDREKLERLGFNVEAVGKAGAMYERHQ